MLADAWERVASERCVRTRSRSSAPPASGKSRLSREFLDGARRDGRARPLPLLRRGHHVLAGGRGRDAAARRRRPRPTAAIAALLGDGQATRADEIAFAVRKLFEAGRAERPLVVVFDDLHWAEPTFLDLIEHVADWSRGAPILLLCLARPELLDRAAGWGGGKLNATHRAARAALGDGDRRADRRALAGATLEPALRERIRAAAEGNPLFVEEMLAMVDGVARAT